MLVCSVVPNLSAALLLLPGGFPGNLPDKLPDQLPAYRPAAPMFPPVRDPQHNPTVQAYRKQLAWLRCRWDQLEAERRNTAHEVESLWKSEEYLRDKLRKAETAPPSLGAWMPLVTDQQRRELSGQPGSVPKRD